MPRGLDPRPPEGRPSLRSSPELWPLKQEWGQLGHVENPSLLGNKAGYPPRSRARSDVSALRGEARVTGQSWGDPRTCPQAELGEPRFLTRTQRDIREHAPGHTVHSEPFGRETCGDVMVFGLSFLRLSRALARDSIMAALASGLCPWERSRCEGTGRWRRRHPREGRGSGSAGRARDRPALSSRPPRAAGRWSLSVDPPSPPTVLREARSHCPNVSSAANPSPRRQSVEVWL